MELATAIGFLNTGAMAVFLYLFFKGHIVPKVVVDDLVKVAITEALTQSSCATAEAMDKVLETHQELLIAAVAEMTARTIVAVNAMNEEQGMFFAAMEQRLSVSVPSSVFADG